MPVTTRSASARSSAFSLSNRDGASGGTSNNRIKNTPDRDSSAIEVLPSDQPSSARSRRPSYSSWGSSENGRTGGAADNGADIPPTYDIDLSLPPEERYVKLAKDFASDIQELVGIFDEVLTLVRLPISSKHLKRVSKLLLRRIHDSEQQAELEGISKATGVDMYLLVAFNVLLDLFMGCTSGGVRVTDGPGKPTKMIHFRMLDWGMDALRRVVVQLNFVFDGQVVARSVTYAGFVGVITGVRYASSCSATDGKRDTDDPKGKISVFPSTFVPFTTTRHHFGQISSTTVIILVFCWGCAQVSPAQFDISSFHGLSRLSTLLFSEDIFGIDRQLSDGFFLSNTIAI
jgi:hypothetical protein